jgi:fructokinase
VTRGGKGAVAFGLGEPLELPGRRIDVVDTVGAGDTFHAGLLSWLDANNLLTPQGVAALTNEQVTAALDFAAAAAAIVCTRRGANPPSWAEIEHFMAARARS